MRVFKVQDVNVNLLMVNVGAEAAPVGGPIRKRQGAVPRKDSSKGATRKSSSTLTERGPKKEPPGVRAGTLTGVPPAIGTAQKRGSQSPAKKAPKLDGNPSNTQPETASIADAAADEAVAVDSPVRKGTRSSPDKKGPVQKTISTALTLKGKMKNGLIEAGADKEEIMQVETASYAEVEAVLEEGNKLKEKKPLKKAVLKDAAPVTKVSFLLILPPIALSGLGCSCAVLSIVGGEGKWTLVEV